MDRRTFIKGLIASLALPNTYSKSPDIVPNSIDDLVFIAPDFINCKLNPITTLPSEKFDKTNVILTSFNENILRLYVDGKIKYEFDGVINGHGAPKKIDNDKKNPIGLYFISDATSLSAKKGSREYNIQKAITKSRKGWQGEDFYRLNHPHNPFDVYNGLQNNLISEWAARKLMTTVPKYKDIKNTKLGNGTAIHGRLKGRKPHQLTWGCSAISNEEFDLIRPYINVSTPVICLESLDAPIDDRFNLPKYEKLLVELLRETYPKFNLS